jgi:hypothetical protein
MRMQEIEADYRRYEEADAAYTKADMEHDEAAVKEAREAYHKLLEEVRAKGKDYSFMMRLYSDMKKRHNDYIDMDGTYDDEEKIIGIFRDFGVKAFTFTSTWSSALESAWNYQKAGTKVDGMIEVNGNQKISFGSDEVEFEKKHGFLFTL